MRGTVVGTILLLLATIGAANATQHPYSSTTYGSFPPPIVSSSVKHSPHMDGRTQHKKRRVVHKSRRRVRTTGTREEQKAVGGLTTVSTAAGIPITVASNLVNQFKGFIQDLVKDGYTPKRIGCWAPIGTHVPNSNHHHGGACDFDQKGWGITAPKMYHVRDLAAKWGLRDGCSFRHPDCGHIDDGRNIGWRFPHNLIARYIDYTQSPKPKSELTPTKESFTPFEE